MHFVLTCEISCCTFIAEFHLTLNACSPQAAEVTNRYILFV